MKVLIQEKLSPHKVKTPEGYLICQDAVLARTGTQEYMRKEIFEGDDSTDIIEVDRKPEQVFAAETLASFENKPLTCEHPDGQVTPENFRDLAVGWVRDIHRGKYNGQDVMLGNLVITDPQCIEDVENGERTDLSCGYDCDVTNDDHPQQINIRGNHVALCEQGRAGIARIIDSKTITDAGLKDLTHACQGISGFKKISGINDILKLVDTQTCGKYKSEKFTIDDSAWVSTNDGLYSKKYKCSYTDSRVPVTLYTTIFATDSEGKNIIRNNTYFYTPTKFFKDNQSDEVQQYLNAVQPEVYSDYDQEFAAAHGKDFIPFAKKYMIEKNINPDDFYFDQTMHYDILNQFIREQTSKFAITEMNLEDFISIIKKLADREGLIKYVDLSDGAIYITLLTHNENEVIPDELLNDLYNVTRYIKNVMCEVPTEHECVISISFDTPEMITDSHETNSKHFYTEGKKQLAEIIDKLNNEAIEDNKTYMDYESRKRLKRLRTEIRENIKENINHFANEVRRESRRK